MQANPKEIISPQALTATLQTLYTSPAKKRTIITKVTFANRAPQLAGMVVHVVPDGDTAGPTNMVLPERDIGANESWSAYQLEGLILEPGYSLAIKTDAEGDGLMNVVASGLEVF